MSKYSKKLGSDNSYKRPKKTFQETLSADEITEKIKGYCGVDDITQVPLNTHIRYFITGDDGSPVFRMGGFLKDKSNADKYVILTNGKNHWCVQINGTKFLRKMTHNEEIESLHEMYQKKIKDKDYIIKKLEKFIQQKNPNFKVSSIISSKKK
ncbi:hypothetical protein ma241 [Moumouvirus australiensis]|uniref:Uncharacterized protein n=1 Tax=Moumouvirus australiensis TaxID=2109587 RepID=A0A2P1EL80_9VIRU|nr:hypothetical protein QKC55_gp663 [Moumouvirus australiensis]AVL94627.1 hypothetical protein ma241 [Moumouvirus australiensis]